MKPNTIAAAFASTGGRCHLCGKQVCKKHYGQHGARGAWEVDHSVPRALGGTYHGNNLRAAHTICNRSKGAGSTRAVRRKNGLSRALKSYAQAARREENAIVGTVVDGVVGAIFGGPGGAAVGAAFGRWISG
jgi:5-methylcytosine-specific restriction endonuclease McrA